MENSHKFNVIEINILWLFLFYKHWGKCICWESLAVKVVEGNTSLGRYEGK
jgi:hypothetical protein